MDRLITVLVYPCGAESSLEVFHALKDVVHIRVFGASSRSDHGTFLFKRSIEGVPDVHAPYFITAINARIAEHGIDAIFPCHDTVAEFLAGNRDAIRARIVCSEGATASICRSKKRTYAAMSGTEHLPVTFTSDPPPDAFPLFAKPDKGEGGRDALRINSVEELDRFSSAHRLEDHLLCEFLPGEEYTIDCFSDRHGALRFIGPRTRERVWAGVSVRTSALREEEFRPMAEAINARIRMRGLWFFQAKRDRGGTLKLLEVSTRAASSMGLFRQLGVNLPLLSLYDAFDMDVRIVKNTFAITMDRALTTRYRTDLEYRRVYLDLDDTLLHGDRVDRTALIFAHQCKEQGKELVLITKHERDVEATLTSIGISERLFDRIIHLRAEEEKADHIEPQGAIFIDNMFAERRKVAERFGIPVFDVDAIACLIDHRE